MPPTDLRATLGPRGLRTDAADHALRAEGDRALADFRGALADVQRRVRRGDMTPRAARERAAVAAAELRDDLHRRARSFQGAPAPFADGLARERAAREKAGRAPTIDALQRETNELLRTLLVEQQLGTRVGEFESRTFARPIGGGQPVPTVEGLLAFLDESEGQGDATAVEWARRQLAAQRPLVIDEGLARRVDRARRRPHEVDPSAVAEFVAALEDRPAAGLAEFVAQAIAAGDASACVAAFVAARQSGDPADSAGVREVIAGLSRFPRPALDALAGWEQAARLEESDAALERVGYAVASAQAEARLDGLEAPRESDLRRADRILGRTPALAGEPLGLALQRRGLRYDELADLDLLDQDDRDGQPV